MYDVIIVGAGPAGLTAALYTARRELKTLVLSKELGGQAALTDKIYNYPGVKFTAGLPLMTTMKEQAEEFGAEFLFEEVRGIEKQEDGFLVKSSTQEFKAHTVLLCFGLTPRDLDVPGEKVLIGKGVQAEVLDHGHMYKGKDVAVIGGGNSALEAAEFLSPLANKVYIVHRRDEFRAEEVTVTNVKKLKNIEFVLNAQTQSVQGADQVESITIDVAGEEKVIPVSAVFVKIGYRTKTDWLGDLVERDARGHIKATLDCSTPTDGLFAAGDCTDMPYKQIITSGGEGCKAALNAYMYLMKKKGKRASMIDWS